LFYCLFFCAAAAAVAVAAAAAAAATSAAAVAVAAAAAPAPAPATATATADFGSSGSIVDCMMHNEVLHLLLLSRVIVWYQNQVYSI